MARPEVLRGSLTPAIEKIPSKASPGTESRSDLEAEIARYLPQLGRMSEQLKQTSKQIEDSVVGVCDSFQGIAVRARATVGRALGFLGNEAQSSSHKQSFEGLIDACSGTLVKIMNTTAEAG